MPRAEVAGNRSSQVAGAGAPYAATIGLGMYYPDLGTICQVASGPRVRAIGWLAAGEDFTRGAVDLRVANKLDLLAEDGWMHVAMPGPHECELCDGGRSAANVLVPGDGVLFVAPAMVTHYMTVHEYLPPAAFRSSVLRCPDPRSDAYFAALRPFVEVFSLSGGRMTEATFDQYAVLHRARLAERDEAAAEAANRKGFTWD